METLFETDSLGKMEQAVSTAFFRGYGLFFTYYKVKGDPGDLGEHEKRTLEVISASTTSRSFTATGTGQRTVRIRTVNNSGNRSSWTSISQNLVPREVPAPQFDRASRIVFGVTLNTPITINSSTGLVTIGSTSFKYTSAIGTIFETTSGSSAQTTQAFSTLSSGQDAYFYFDKSLKYILKDF